MAQAVYCAGIGKPTCSMLVYRPCLQPCLHYERTLASAIVGGARHVQALLDYSTALLEKCGNIHGLQNFVFNPMKFENLITRHV
jgi:hypothetical protein